MELFRVHLLLGAVGFLLWTSGGSAAPMECHFSSRGEIQFFITLLKKTPKHLPLKKTHQFIKKFIILSSSPHHVFVQLCVCTRGGTTHWVKPGWTTLACNAPVYTLLGSVAVRREYTNRRCDLVSRCQQFLNRMV